VLGLFRMLRGAFPDLHAEMALMTQISAVPAA
jgi:hypothetical protein